MSGGSGGPIIINNIIENPDTTAQEKEDCRAILLKTCQYGACAFWDAVRVCRIVWRLLR